MHRERPGVGATVAEPDDEGLKQASDWVECVAWGARQRRSVATWRVGDVVEIEGAFRRRFYRGGAGTAMRLEVEVLAGRMVRRGERRAGDRRRPQEVS